MPGKVEEMFSSKKFLKPFEATEKVLGKKWVDSAEPDVICKSNSSGVSSVQQTGHPNFKMATSDLKLCSTDPELKHEKERLKTFVSYPHNATQSSITLAHNGFVYIGEDEEDAVKCVFCKLVKSSWQKTEGIEEEHARLSCNCPMVTKQECGNVPMKRTTSTDSFSKSWKGLVARTKRQGKGRSQSSHEGESKTSIATGKMSQGDAHLEATKSSSVKSDGERQNTAVKESSQMSGQPFPTEHFYPTAQTTPVGPVNEEADSFASSAVVTSKSLSYTSLLPHLRADSESSNTESASPNTVPQNGHHRSTANGSSNPTNHLNSDPHESRAAQQSGNVAHSPNAPTSTACSGAVPHNGTSSTSAAVPQTNGSAPRNARNEQPNSGRRVAPNSKNPSFEDLSIHTARPKRSEYAIKAKRLESFQGWPAHHHLKPEVLADAGFFYTGFSDTARCFHCGGGLRNWEETDDAWVEHARWFPKCVHVRLVKGKEFVDAVKELSKDHDVISHKDVVEKLSMTFPEYESDGLQSDPAVLAIVEMGFQMNDVVDVARSLKEEGLSGASLSSDKLYKEVRQNKPQVSRQEKACCSDDQSESSTEKEEQVDVELMRETIQELREQTLCKICYDKNVGVVFLPCGHFVSCTDCASAMKNCPVCRENVKGLVHCYVS